MTNRLSLNGEEIKTEAELLSIGEHGTIAKLEDGNVVVSNKDAIELFRFNAQACPFKEQPIRFLVEIYAVGFQKAS